MTNGVNLSEIRLKDAIPGSGHNVNNATLNASNKKVIFKFNKHNKSRFSRLEVAFTHLASLFLPTHSTPAERLVLNTRGDKPIVEGLIVEHLTDVIFQKEGVDKPFYTVNLKSKDGLMTAKKIAFGETDTIPYYFLNHLPHGFFTNLVSQEKANLLSIDYDSLAQILTTSYTLEEDDLHKGNFGFYIVERLDKPHVVFFKIDHDLMFVDSIMSFAVRRQFHWFDGASAFDIKGADLLNFPRLSYSSNFYWPTKPSHFLSNPFNSKEYHTKREVDSFSHLSENEAFTKAKWLSFYKHILIPADLIALTLEQCLDQNDPQDKAKISLLLNATIARQAHLKAVLFSLREFREFVSQLSPEEKEALHQDIKKQIPAATSDERIQSIIAQTTSDLTRFHTLCNSDSGFRDCDTPLHTAIRLGDFRYEETLRMFGNYLNEVNQQQETPLDLAMRLEREKQASGAITPDARSNLRLTMRYLVESGAHQSVEFKQFNQEVNVETYTAPDPYLDRVTQAQTYLDLKKILSDLGEDQHYCLKFKKKVAIDCISQFIDKQKNHPQLNKMLLQLKMDINGSSGREAAAPLKYLRQLRSHLWIVRQIRGLYGNSSSLQAINTLVDKQLKTSTVKTSCWTFFHGHQSTKAPLMPNDQLLHLGNV